MTKYYDPVDYIFTSIDKNRIWNIKPFKQRLLYAPSMYSWKH